MSVQNIGISKQIKFILMEESGERASLEKLHLNQVLKNKNDCQLRNNRQKDTLAKDTFDQEQARIAAKVPVNSLGWVTENMSYKNSIKAIFSMKL